MNKYPFLKSLSFPRYFKKKTIKTAFQDFYFYSPRKSECIMMYHANPYQYPIAFHFFRFSSFFFLLLKGPQKSSRIKKYIFLKFPIVLPVYLWYISFSKNITRPA